MNDIPLPAEFLKPHRRPPAEPPRRRVPRIETWSEYRAASARAANEPGPAGEADRQAALRFAADRMPGDIMFAYVEDLRRRR